MDPLRSSAGALARVPWVRIPRSPLSCAVRGRTSRPRESPEAAARVGTYGDATGAYLRNGSRCATRGPRSSEKRPMLIGNPSPPKRPVVSVTAPASSKQVRIAFNAPLVRHASLQDVPYMAIDLDVERQRVTFISTTSREY